MNTEQQYKRLKELKARMPGYTCPDIDKVYDFLRSCQADDLCEVLDKIRKDNGDLREIAKQAFRGWAAAVRDR